MPVFYHEGRFPPESRLDWLKLVPLIGPAVAAIARYDGVLSAVPNSTVLLSPLITQEAVLSSRIEGTQATMGEVLEYEAVQETSSPNQRDDIQEVLNYRTAMRTAEAMLADIPFSQRVIREAHRVLLSDVRGMNKSPGEYRRVPNWIGPPGCTIEDAKFVPIDAQKLPNAMSTWEHYANRDAPDHLVQLAILHAEFEALHPFLDGNGRLGRMLLPLFLWQRHLIQKPTFYISAYFESHRDAYYDGLLAVSRDDDWTEWCQFFLRAVKEQAQDNISKAQEILELYDRMKPNVADLTHSQYAIHALDWIFQTPIFQSTHFIESLQIPPPTARRILNQFRQGGILKEIREGRGRRPAVLAFSDILNVAEGQQVF